MKIRMRWNGGRNGWASFMVGADWRVNGYGMTTGERLAEVRAGRWFACVYLGLWAVSFTGRAY